MWGETGSGAGQQGPGLSAVFSQNVALASKTIHGSGSQMQVRNQKQTHATKLH